jgi:hypothetical protein
MAGAMTICVGWDVDPAAGASKVGAAAPGSDGSGADDSEAAPHAMDARINISAAAEINIGRRENFGPFIFYIYGSCISAGAIGWMRVSRGFGAYPHTKRVIEIARIRMERKRRMRFFIYLE